MKTFDEALRSTFCVGAEAENPEVALCIESQKGIMTKVVFLLGVRMGIEMEKP